MNIDDFFKKYGVISTHGDITLRKVDRKSLHCLFLSEKFGVAYKVSMVRNFDKLDEMMRDIKTEYPDTQMFFMDNTHYILFTLVDSVKIKLLYSGERKGIHI